MKKHILLLTNLLICAIVILGFISINTLSYRSQNKLLSENIENISNLASLNVHSQIVNTFSESIHVSQTMSNDTFLIEWLRNEGKSPDVEQISEITNYLSAYKTKNNYNSAFMVSQNTLNYYSYNGVNKVLSKSDAHDVWFDKFIESGEPYRLEIDYDQVNSNHITMFVNCRITDNQNNFLGVVGVGLQIDKIQSLLLTHENDYNLKACLVDKGGNVMIRASGDNIIKDNYFDDIADDTPVRNIIDNKSSPQIQWLNSKELDRCIITQYIKDFDWYLVIEKDNSEVKAAAALQFKINSVIIGIIAAVILLIVAYIVKRYNDIVYKMATTDKLTKLQNREAFYSDFDKTSKKSEYRNGTIFMFDIDDFKAMNDNNGHLYGDGILEYVANFSAEYFRDIGTVARWGGDEFIGLLKGGNDSHLIFENFIVSLATGENQFKQSISISIGTAVLPDNADINDMVTRIDSALYKAKSTGKRKVC